MKKITVLYKDFFASRLPEHRLKDLLSFEEKMHLYNAYVWYHYITQEFLMCFKYARLWVDLFEEYPFVKEAVPGNVPQRIVQPAQCPV